MTCFSEDMLLGWVQLSITFLKGAEDTKTQILKNILIARPAIRHIGKKYEWTWPGHAF